MRIKRGGIYLAALDPTVGSEIAKTRPVLVVSNDINNKFSGTATILPITSKKTDKIYPFEMGLPRGTGNLPKDSKVKANQIRTMDQSRLIKLIGQIDTDLMRGVEEAIMIHLQIKK